MVEGRVIRRLLVELPHRTPAPQPERYDRPRPRPVKPKRVRVHA